MTLGPEFESVMAEVIDQHMQELHDGNTDSKAHIEDFLEHESAIRSSKWELLKLAERWLTDYRKNHQLQSFDWSRETRENLSAILGLDKGNPRLPRSIEVRQQILLRKYLSNQNKGDSLETALKENNLDMLKRVTKLKPQYQGLNHPLELNQIIRKPK